MRYRKLDQNDDMQFGHNIADFWKNQVDGVGQAIKTRLLLYRGEWFLDLTEGTPWGGFPLSDAVVAQGQILGKGTQKLRDLAIQTRVLETTGVLGISNYFSTVEPDTRKYKVGMDVNTIYGQLMLSSSLSRSGQFSLDVSPLGGDAGL